MFKKVVCAISGGVDSAVTALLLKNKGFHIVGVHMKNWDNRDESATCLNAETDLQDAKAVCSLLDIDFIDISFVKEYWNDVFSMVLEDYQNGLTPNPDIFCNKYIKFGALYRFAIEEMKFDALATGHYARNSFGNYLENYTTDENAYLMKGIDYSKDQTLFLSQIQQEALRRTMFPLGDLFKTHVRQIAREHEMDKVSRKRDSTGICFIGRREFKDFIAEYIRSKAGQFIDVDTGESVGCHDGVHNFTVGERCKIAAKLHKYYVSSRDPVSQIIYVAKGAHHPSLYGNYVQTMRPHWISNAPSLSRENSFSCLFRFQHGDGCVPCEVFTTDAGLDVSLQFPLRALTPGQIAVFYKGDTCLGGAKITKAGWLDEYREKQESESDLSYIRPKLQRVKNI